MIDNQNNIGQRIRAARKQKGINQTELANLLGKSLRTIQKYESGEIEVSIAMINELAKVLDTTSTFLIGYEHDEKNILSLSDIMDFLFKLDRVKGLNFNIDVKRPPHYDEWECSITFNGKDKSADFNADMCLFLEEFAEYREDFQNDRISAKRYKELQDKDLAYYSATMLEEKPED
ncbi:helix-turn-helix transcriptional regulator [Hungatella sp.]|uniref:helix-turn-helix domain-containing protein n=1 Tax=Hungatella sp. TaxID=2613924 RepID=UPI002625E535|nr:helix-turn-helix transcriptional regulator [Hungatella sp.]